MNTLRKIILAVMLVLPTLLFAGEAVNINTADKEALMTIKGIGERRAEAIIAYRKEHGEFKSVEQLADVKGIGVALVESNRNNLSIEDAK